MASRWGKSGSIAESTKKVSAHKRWDKLSVPSPHNAVVRGAGGAAGHASSSLRSDDLAALRPLLVPGTAATGHGMGCTGRSYPCSLVDPELMHANLNCPG